jgi:16S rRNA (adenine(1408)-N(1))-methyltransferase
LESLELDSFADEVTLHFPWGSLLRGALAEDRAVFEAICRLPRPGGVLTLAFSVVARDGRAPLSAHDLELLAREYRWSGLTLVEARALDRVDVVAARSTWGKRLDVGGKRPGHLMRFRRASAPA